MTTVELRGSITQEDYWFVVIKDDEAVGTFDTFREAMKDAGPEAEVDVNIPDELIHEGTAYSLIEHGLNGTCECGV